MSRSLHVQADRTFLHAGLRTRRYLRVEVVAPKRPPRMPLNMGLVLDRSGSMAGPKLQLAREGATRAVHALQADDRLSVLAYNEEALVLVRSGGADEAAKRVAESRLRALDAVGNTDLCGGWLRGCEQVGLGLDDGRLGRCLLLTDGLANVGTTDHRTIVQHASALRERGVTTSTLGVGRDFDEVLLRQMAEAGGGNFYFAEHASQLSDFIAGETGEATKVAARGATLVVDLPPGASVTSPNPFRIRSEQCRSILELGTLVADQVLIVVLAVDFPEGGEGERSLVQSWLWDPGGALEGAAEQEFSYASDEVYRSQHRDWEVTREAASAYAALARRQAAELGRQGAAAEGRVLLLKMATQVRQQAKGDPQLSALASALEEEAARLERMDRLDYKRLEYSTFGTLRSRGEDGMTIGTQRFAMDRTLQMLMRAERHGAAWAPFHVVAVTVDKEGTRLVETAGRALTAADSQGLAYTIVDGGARVLDSGPGVALSRDDELGLAYALASVSDFVKIAFVRGCLADGAPSHWYAGERVAIVSLSAWNEGASVPAEAFVAYEMVVQGLRQRCPSWDPNVPIHRDGRKCWGEFDEALAGVEAKIEAGDLCPSCRQLYEASGVDVTQLLSLVGAVHDLAGRPAGLPS